MGLTRSFFSLIFATAVSVVSTPLARATMVAESPFSASERGSAARSRFTHGIVRMDALGEFLEGIRNEACAKSRLTKVDFKDLSKFPAGVNYCEVPLAKLPADVRALIEKAGALNAKIAAFLGQDLDETFGMDVEITVSADARGTLASEAAAGQVLLSGLPDWTIADFSPKIYVHEIIHALTFNAGPTADALVGLQDHPLLVEALPDLIASALQGSPGMELGEANLPDCLRILRDETPVQSFDAPFLRFFSVGSTDTIIQCCATLDLAKVPPFAKQICKAYTGARSAQIAKIETFVKSNRIAAVPIDAEHLRKTFAAEDCRLRTSTGLVYLDNCDTHQFAYPLVSFFFRLRELTGKSWVAAFFAKIREGVESTAVYECGFTAEADGAKAYIGLRPLLGPFMALRESMNAADQAAFDDAWKEHDFAKMIDLDRIFRNEALAGLAQIAVKERNPLYRKEHACGNVYDFDPVACGVTCEKKI